MSTAYLWRERRGARRLSLVVAPVALLAGCGRSAPPEERNIVPHLVAGCDAPPGGPDAGGTAGNLVLKALGDFPERAANVGDPRARHDFADLPFNLLGVEATTTPSSFLGVGYANPPDDIHLSLWSSSESCSPVDFQIPPSHGGQAMTAFDDGNAVIVAGLDPSTDQSQADAALALVWDTRTGEMSLPTLGPVRRAWATATPFGHGALIAGGVDKYPSVQVIDSALVFRGGQVQDATIHLGDPRTRHGAVVLADGSTLLVGGASANNLALPSMVVVIPTDDPPYGRAVIFGLGTLRTPRKAPQVLRLADDKIVVAGGFDNGDQLVSTIEWFTKDAFACSAADACPPGQTLPARAYRTFVALPAGGILTVGTDVISDAATSANNKITSDVLWITPQGDVQPLAPLEDSQLPPFADDARTRPKNARLVPASDGAPWLYNGQAWFRFDPWQGRFIKPELTPIEGADDDLPIIAVDPGLLVWLERGPDADPATAPSRVRGFRHGTRGPMARDTKFVLTDRDPPHIVPDRPLGADLQIEDDGLHLKKGAVGIADAIYGDVVVSGTTRSASLPNVRLGPSFMVGSGECPWPSAGPTDGGVSGVSATRTFEIKRSGSSLTLTVDPGTSSSASRSCSGPDGRVSVALGAPESSPAIVFDFTVTRVPAP